METFELDEFDFHVDVPVDDSGQLQRTVAWLIKRSKCFSGSENNDLMSCGRATAKQAWGSIDKLVDFGAAAETQVYVVGKRRDSDVLEMEAKSKSMDYGKNSEPGLIQKLIDDKVIIDFVDMGFEYFGDYKGGGASVDGKAVYIGDKFPHFKGKTVGMEIKCCTSWKGHKARMYEKVHDKHKDFWQHQSEMLAIGVDVLLYVVAEPMNVANYETQIVLSSKVHQQALLNRCKIADAAIDLWDKYSYSDALKKACAEFKEENE